MTHNGTDLRTLFQIQEDVVFLNHGSFGACPKPVFEVYQGWQRELERQPVEFLGRRFANLMASARRGLGDFLSTDADNLLYVPNATTGLNMVARSLPLRTGDEVLTTNLEYGAIDRMWEVVCKKRGSVVKRQAITFPVGKPDEIVEAVWSGVTARTRVLAMSHITANTALLMPVRQLATRCRQAGIVSVIDGAHAPGQLELNFGDLDVDFYSGNCHKWLMTPKGSAFLYAHPDKQDLLQPLVVSWDHISASPARFLQESEYQGTVDIASYLAVPAAIDFFREHHWPEVQKGCHELAKLARNRLADITNIEPICPASVTWFRQMAAHPLPECNGDALKQRLYEDYRIEIPINEHDGRSYLRVSVQGYNSEQDIDALCDALKKLLPELIITSQTRGAR